jgi:hypothetical protein
MVLLNIMNRARGWPGTAAVLMVGLALAALWPAQAGATTVVVLHPQKDAYIDYIDGSNPNANNGHGLLLLDREETGTAFDYKVYLSFSLPSPGASLATVTDAALQLDPVFGGGVLSQKNASKQFTFKVHGLNEKNDVAWDESGITWNNAPGNNPADGSLPGTTLLGSFVITGTGVGTTVVFDDADTETGAWFKPG